MFICLPRLPAGPAIRTHNAALQKGEVRSPEAWRHTPQDQCAKFAWGSVVVSTEAALLPVTAAETLALMSMMGP